MRNKVSNYDDPEAFRRLRINANDKGDTVLAEKAFRRMCFLLAENKSDPIHTDYYQALAAYEEILIEDVNPSARARRTREALAKRPLLECLDDWAGAKTPTRAFEFLTKRGLNDMTAEAIVMRYSEHFSDTTLATAAKRLKELGD